MARAKNADGEVRRRRPLWLAAKVVFWASVAWFAIEGGEYGTSDLFALRGRIRESNVAIDSLKRVMDSLSLQRKDVQSNPAVQERIAREEFGMVRGDRELLYHVLRPDSGAVSPDSAARVPTP